MNRKVCWIANILFLLLLANCVLSQGVLNVHKPVSFSRYTSNRNYTIKSVGTELQPLQGGFLWIYNDPADNVSSIAVGDFNADSRDDVLVSIAAHHIYALNGANMRQLWHAFIDSRIDIVAINDINDDGQDDVFVGAGRGYVYALNGTDGGQLWSSYLSYHVTTFAFRDLNGDDRDDVLVGTKGGLYALNGIDGSILPGWFIHTLKISKEYVPPFYVNVVLDDRSLIFAVSTMNFHGIIAYDVWGQQVWIHNLTQFRSYSLIIASFAVGDFNDDGIDDILISSYKPTQSSDDPTTSIVHSLNGVNGGLLWEYEEIGGRIYSVAVGDFNNDGVDDGLACYTNKKIYAFNGKNGNTLWINEGFYCYLVAVGDFNADGIDDALACAGDNIYMINGHNGILFYEISQLAGAGFWPGDVAIGDFDNNGVDDVLLGRDHNVYAMSFLVVDSDGDGLADDAEISIYNTNPFNVDTDGDKLDDLEEISMYSTDPQVVETDGDGIADGEEVNKYDTDPRLADTDGDGLPDGQEVSVYHTNPTVADAEADTDWDWLPNVEEVALYGTNPTVEDTDGDGLRDGEEVINYNSNPLSADTDGDGLSDMEEVVTYGTNPSIMDSDGDGIQDSIEIDAGTDPLDPQDPKSEETSVKEFSLELGFLTALVLVTLKKRFFAK